ncbi:nitroreductase [Bacillus mesophilus]|uniref:Nitroreductase family protein n=1 Tax=Bacillus mesophilus TaxID=1808955 RepID=A0A6M0Q898_9BACI|nr:nitroreductase family protein [Bacillus mesophilus]MBM7662140.1 nitroreductase [Bacillus mesophilus]NEY72507.1 nitroreductase family protein [Bacillus mesophilus]
MEVAMMSRENEQLFFDVIERRASVRSFKQKEIPETYIKRLLETAISAPSSGNMQPWEFIIIKKENQKHELVKCTYFGYFSKGENYQTWIAYAGLIIVVCANLKRTCARYGVDGKEWAPIDVAAATENILLAATSLGLAGCWVGGFDEQKLKEYLNIPSYVKPIGMVPIGFPKGTTTRKYRMDLKWLTHDGVYNQPYFKE